MAHWASCILGCQLLHHQHSSGRKKSGALNNEYTLKKNWILLVGLLVEDGHSEGQDPGPDLAGEVGVGPPPRELSVEPNEPGLHLLPIGQPANTFKLTNVFNHVKDT